jgi:hypothetical protein
MKISAIKRDSAAIANGVWVKDIPNLADVEFQVRGQSSPAYAAALARLLRAVPPDQRGRDGNPNTETRILCVAKAVHETILLDWKGIEDEKGKPLPYKKDLAYTWLTHPDFQHFLDGVLWASSVADNTRGADETTLKN